MITHVRVKNYLSLVDVSVGLQPLTVLVGYNGSGKSNFIDVLCFVSEALSLGLDIAINRRGGVSNILRWPVEQNQIEIGLDIDSTTVRGFYGFTLAVGLSGKYSVKHEVCQLSLLNNEQQTFEIDNGVWIQSPQSQLNGRFSQESTLTLPMIGDFPFNALYHFLTDMGFYDLWPAFLREPQKVDAPHPLRGDGRNLTSVLKHIMQTRGSMEIALKAMLPDVIGYEVTQVGEYLFTKLRHSTPAGEQTFDLFQESEGTLRVLGILAALYQSPPQSLIAIEEPELYVHPGIMAILWEEFIHKAASQQIILTTHSPDLLDMCNVEQLRIVEKINGATVIGSLEEAQKRIVQKRLATPGQLLQTEGLYRAQPA